MANLIHCLVDPIRGTQNIVRDVKRGGGTHTLFSKRTSTRMQCLLAAN